MADLSFRIAIIGSGQVGGAVAYALILRSFASELLLVDVDLPRRDAQVHDLSDVTYSSNSNTRVRAANYHEASQCDIIVITAGSKYFIGETSILHMYRNVGIIRNVVKAMSPFKRDAVLLIVSNPVDLMTQVAQQLSGLPDAQVIGSGTLLDSVRLRQLLADEAGISAKSTEILVLGIQGDSQVAAWSTAKVGGVPISTSILSKTIDSRKLEQECKDRTKNIVKAKGATPYGIGSIVARLCSSICFDEREVLPLSHFQHEFGCYFSSPVILGRKGIVKNIQVPLEIDEKARIEQSVEDLKEFIGRMSGDFQD